MKRAFILGLLFFSLPARAAVTEITSEHGIKAWLIEEHSLPVFAVKLAFTQAGTAYDPHGKEGRANLTAALLTEGAGELSERAFSEAIESHAISLEMGAEEDLFHVSLESLSEHRDKAFELMGMALTRPRFEADATARAKSQARSVLAQQESSPGYALQQALAAAAFGEHPYARSVLGTPGGIEALERADLEQFRSRYLTRQNMVVAIVGDLTPAEAKRLLDSALATLPENYRPEGTVAETTPPVPGITRHVEFDVPQMLVGFVFPGLKRRDPDYMTAYVMNAMVGGGSALNNRLGREIREKRGLSYGVSTSLEALDHAALFKGGLATRRDQSADAIATLKQTLADFGQSGPTDEEFRDAKSYLKDSFILNLDSNADVAAFLIIMQVHALGIDYLERRNTLVEAVTQEAVKAMARRLIVLDNMTLVTVGKAP